MEYIIVTAMTLSTLENAIDYKGYYGWQVTGSLVHVGGVFKRKMMRIT